MRNRIAIALLFCLVTVALAQQATPISNPPLDEWKAFKNDMVYLDMRFPPTWFANQGHMFPPFPLATKFSTYQAKSDEAPEISMRDAEISVMLTSQAPDSDIIGLEKKGYVKKEITCGGEKAVRLTSPTLAHGLTDVIFFTHRAKTFRIALSAVNAGYIPVFDRFLSAVKFRK